jgi:hypothetical protein
LCKRGREHPIRGERESPSYPRTCLDSSADPEDSTRRPNPQTIRQRAGLEIARCRVARTKPVERTGALAQVDDPGCAAVPKVTGARRDRAPEQRVVRAYGDRPLRPVC